MTSSLDLLALTHAAAVPVIVRESLVSPDDADNLLIGTSVVHPDGTTDIPVYIDPEAYNDPNWHYQGEISLSYQRLDLGDTFGALGLHFKVTPTYTTEEIAAKLASIFAIVIEPGDYVHQTLTLTTPSELLIFQALPDSLRYKGQVAIRVHL